MSSKKVSKKQMISIYEKMGLINISSERESLNGTLKFYDEISQCNFIFRKWSNPRVEYVSEKTNTIQSYDLFRDEDITSISEKMVTAIPYISNRKVKAAYRRSLYALDITKNLITSFNK
jgi:hypothetical protein